MEQLSFSRKSIWQISYPVMAAGLSQSLLMLTDTAFLGHLGEVELGAGGMANMWYFLLVVTAMGLSNGLQVLVSRRLGEGKNHAVGRVVNHGLMLAAIFMVITFVAIYWGIPLLLGSFYLESEAVLAATTDYLSIRVWDLPCVFFVLLMRGFYTGIGQTRIIMWSTLMPAVLNLILCFFLVLGLWGFPRLGMQGAALSTVIAQAAGAGVMVVHLLRSGHIQQYRMFRRERVRGYLLRTILNLSGPTIMQYLLSMAGFLYLMYEVEKLSETALAASELVKTVYLTLMIPTWGFQAAASTLVSYVIGAGHRRAVMSILWRIAAMNLSAAVVLSLFVLVIPRFTFSMYTSSEHLMEAAIWPGYVVGITLILFAGAAVYLNGVIGSGATKFALLSEIVTISLYCIFIAIAAHVWHGGLGLLWSCEFIYMGLLWINCYFYMRSGRWRKLQV